MTRVLIVGASGRTGRHLVAGALARGLAVTALVPHGAPPDLLPAEVVRAEGNVLQAATLAPAVRGQDAVLCVLGPRTGSPPTLCSEGTLHLIAAMKGERVARLVIVTGAMIGHPTEGLGWLYRALREAVPEGALADRRLQESLVTASGLDWTIVRPPRLTDGASHGHWRVGEAIHLGAFARIARADLAEFMLGQVNDRTLVRRGVSISY